MARDDSQMTRDSLLLRLRTAQDAVAWQEFYDTYWALIVGFARRRGCNEQMARDVLQETLVTIFQTMPEFDYDRDRGHFRSYLLRIVRNHIQRARRRERKYADGVFDDPAAEALLAVDDHGVNELDQLWDREWEGMLLRRALERVKASVEPETFRSFQLYVLERRPAEEVAERLGIGRNLVYQHRCRLIEMLQREVQALKWELGEV